MLSTLFDGHWRARTAAGGCRLAWVCLTLGLFGMSAEVLAHAIAQGDKGYIQEITGVNLVAFIYLGAKHMVTGYDHLLFLLGVIFFLYRVQYIAIYISLFALDPTGAGRLFGLTEMGEIKEQLAQEAAADDAAQMVAVKSSIEEARSEPVEPVFKTVAVVEAEPEAAPKVEQPAPPMAADPEWQDEVRVVLTPGEGTEFKLTMQEGAIARFSWVAIGGPLNFDTHGDGFGQSVSYEKAGMSLKTKAS